MSTIRLQDVTKQFPPPANSPFAQAASSAKPLLALDHVNLTIPDGQTMAVVGPSGCGKSTLLRVIAGLEVAYQGHIFYDEQLMEDIPPKDRHIGMVFQNYALYPHFKGYGNLAFFFRLRQISDEETQERIRLTSEIMGIGFNDLLRRKPGTLSGGQQQRVAIARAIVRNPRLFLFDEPLSSLDAKLRAQTRTEIKRLLRRFQITAIYVTHDQTEAITLGDRLAIMQAGRVEQVGTYHDLHHNPANAFVAGFLGQPPMNLFHGGLVGEDGLHLAGLTLPLPETIKARTQPGQSLILGARPEDLRVRLDSPPPGSLGLRGTIEVKETDYSRRLQLVHLRTGPLAYVATAGLAERLRIDEEVAVDCPVEALYFFDAASEERVGREL